MKNFLLNITMRYAIMADVLSTVANKIYDVTHVYIVIQWTKLEFISRWNI